MSSLQALGTDIYGGAGAEAKHLRWEMWLLRGLECFSGLVSASSPSDIFREKNSQEKVGAERGALDGASSPSSHVLSPGHW